MTRIRLSATVDKDLLAHARSACGGSTGAALIDIALSALFAQNRSAAIAAGYAAYDAHPIDEPDEWGDFSERADQKPNRRASRPRPAQPPWRKHFR